MAIGSDASKTSEASRRILDDDDDDDELVVNGRFRIDSSDDLTPMKRPRLFTFASPPIP